MSDKWRVASFCALVLLWAAVVQAQLDDNKIFNLSTAEMDRAAADTVAAAAGYEPRIEPGKLEFGLTMGFLGLNKTLLSYDHIIYKTSSDAFYFGNLTLKGESAFTPFIHAAYNLTPFLAVEGLVGISFSNYQAKLDSLASVSPEGGAVSHDVDLGLFDAERRSVFALLTNLNAVFYPLNLGDEGRGRLQPFLTGGIGRASYNLDSNYTDNSAGGFSAEFGGGLRLIADDLVSLRLEVVKFVHTIEFKPGQFFDSRDDGTVKVPVYEFARNGTYSEVKSYGSNVLGGLAWSIGITASF